MSYHYGVSKRMNNNFKKNSRVINYQLFFVNTKKDFDSYPVNVNIGYPFARLYCRGHHPNAGFKILTHRFDTDSIINAPFRVLLKIRICLDDNTVQLIDLEEIDYFNKEVVRNEASFFLEKEYKFKDVKKLGTRDIYAFDILFRQLSDGNYGNESVMDIVVDY